MLSNLWIFLKNFIVTLTKCSIDGMYRPAYRLIAIDENEDGEYIARVQIINKNKTFYIKPEEVLADDKFVDAFSPCDVRALTYLGYLGVNSPKYKILAKRFSENSNGILFALKRKSDKRVILKSASEIATELNVKEDFDPKDSHAIGYTLGSEGVLGECQMKKNLLDVTN